MSETKTAAQPQPSSTRRGRRRKVESYANWMARIDAQVDAAARKMSVQPPSYAWLHPAQKMAVEMLIEHMRGLPELRPDENAYSKWKYHHFNMILTKLFQSKYPSWTQTFRNGSLDVNALPNGDAKVFEYMLRNCAGRAPAEIRRASEEEDD